MTTHGKLLEVHVLYELHLSKFRDTDFTIESFIISAIRCYWQNT